MIYKNQDNHTYWLIALNQCWVLMVNGIVKCNGPVSHFLVTKLSGLPEPDIAACTVPPKCW